MVFLTQRPMLEMFGVEEKVISLTIEVLLKTTPAMALRPATDAMNNMIQATGRIEKLGVLSFFNMLLFFAYSYLSIAVLDQGINGYCLMMFLYQLTSLMVCLYFYLFELEVDIRDTSIGIFDNLCWYILEILKVTLGSMCSIISRESLIIILTVAKNTTDLATFTPISSLEGILKAKSISVTSQSLNKLNFLLAKRDFPAAKRYYLKTLFIFLIEGMATGVVLYFAIPYVFYWSGSSQVFQDAINDTKLLLALTTIAMDIFMWVQLMAFSVNKKLESFLTNVVLGVGMLTGVGWYLIVHLKMRMVGILFAIIADHVVRTVVLFLVIEVTGLESYEGVKM